MQRGPFSKDDLSFLMELVSADERNLAQGSWYTTFPPGVYDRQKVESLESKGLLKKLFDRDDSPVLTSEAYTVAKILEKTRLLEKPVDNVTLVLTTNGYILK